MFLMKSEPLLINFSLVQGFGGRGGGGREGDVVKSKGNYTNRNAATVAFL